MKTRKKTFDAVQMMRKIRDRLSLRFQSMSFEEQARAIRVGLNGSHAKMTPSQRRSRKTF